MLETRWAALAMAVIASACTSAPHAGSAPSSRSKDAEPAGVQVCHPGECPDDEPDSGPVPPDEPYRYVQAPTSAHHSLAPQAAHQTVRLDHAGSLPANFLNSHEVGPQVSLYFAEGALRGASGTRVSISATPLAPTGASPADGRIVGNEYSLLATAQRGPLKFVSGAMSVQLRVPQPSSSARYLIELLQGGAWADLKTTVVGNDIVLARPPRMGTVALVQTADGGTA